MDENDALALFSGADENMAQRGFGLLCETLRPALHGFLRRHNYQNADDREEIIQETLLQLWRRRTYFQNLGIPAWRAYSKRAALWQAGTSVLPQKKPQTVPLEDWDGAETEPVRDTLLSSISGLIESEQLEMLADVTFLGLDTKLAPRAHTRRLLAAQLFYLDNEPWQRILKLLSSGDGETVTRDILDEWLCDPRVLRHLAFRALYYDGVRLAAHILEWNAEGEDMAQSLDVLARRTAQLAASDPYAPSPCPPFSHAEMMILLWRWRYGLTPEQIEQRSNLPLPRAEILPFLDRTAARTPFPFQMKQIVQKTAAILGEESVLRIYAGRELWQRLAFQYRYYDDLSHKEIQARLQPSAQIARTDVTLAQLNVWLSGGRLIDRLAAPLAQMGLE